MPHPLDCFFAPDSIALIGASRDLEKIPGRLLSMLRKNEYPGKIYPINPNYGDIDGLKCYPSIADVGAADRSRHHHHSRPARCSARSSNAPPPASRTPSSSPRALPRRAATAPRCRTPSSRWRNGPACGFPVPMPRVSQRSAEGRGDLQPDGRRQAGPCAAGRDHSAGSPSSRNPAASALPSSIAPRRSALRSAIASAPAMKPISAPASFSITWCRMPPPT